MIWSREFGMWTFEILWSYGVSLGVREIRCPKVVHWGFAVDVPFFIFTFWRP